MIGTVATRALELLFRALIRFYQLLISPLLGPRCRFAPTCSEYAMDAIALHGPVTGLWLAVKRLARCHPWGGSGLDPVPHRLTMDRQNSACGCGHVHHS